MALAAAPVVECRGHGRQRGRAHGEALRPWIRALLERWDADAESRLRRPAATLVADLVGGSGFLAAIERHTPDLLEEVRGIAEGAGVAFERVLALNLMDEEWWMTAPAEPREACTLVALAGEGERPTVLAQNMDLPVVMDGAQAILRTEDAGGCGAILTAAGMIGLMGVNPAGVGVCVNTLAMLRHSRGGLPVAFVMRGALEHSTAAEAAGFLARVPHASGQHYALADADGVAGYECSAAGAVRSDAGSGRLCHTNHPLGSRDLDPARRAEGGPDSHTRLAAIEAAAADIASGGDCEAVLADRETPLCVIPEPGRPWITFGSIAAELGRTARVRIAPGPPDRTGWLDVV
jgi:isopenicillin-N N-acyltransferase like protein